jgi:signal transduction histidine kinase/ActR/RegA family two-component response regulator
MYFTLFGLVMFGFRFTQVGPSFAIFFQMGISLAVVLLVSLRRHFPRKMVLYASFSGLFLVLTMAVSRFGLLSPGIGLTFVLPFIVGNIFGLRSGLISMLAMAIMLSVIGFLFINGQLQIVGGSQGYFQKPGNWILHITLYVGMVSWGIALTSKAGKYWREAAEDLAQQVILREESDVRSTQTELWWGTMGDSFAGVLFDMIIDNDGNEKVIRISNGTNELWGVTGQEIIDDINVLNDRLHPDYLADLEKHMVVAADNMAPWNMRVKCTHLNGAEKWVHAGGKPMLTPDGGLLWHNLAIDITDQVRAEEDAKHQQKLLAQYQRQESIGQLSGGVAHDFNNLLAVIMGNLEFIRDGADTKEMIAYVDQALEATAKGADLTRNMLAFAKKAVLDPVSLNLNDIAREATGWISRTIPENIDIDTKLEPNLRVVQADEGSVVSAMLNLIVNARDAMHAGGHLLVETFNTNLTPEDARNIDAKLEAGAYVVLSVTDTGSGIAAVDQDRIFDPFVTTKGPTKGTGLGLAMVQGFMRQSRGAVEVKSGVGKGATFSLFFRAEPEIVAENTNPNTAVKHSKIQTPQTTARILVVEDQTDLLDYLQAVLTRFGYRVQTATTGDAAWNLFNQDTHFDLILTDHIMPGHLQGADLARKIRAQDPDIPVIIMSGYAGIKPSDDPNQPTTKIDLFKPIKRVDLIAAIEKALAP